MAEPVRLVGALLLRENRLLLGLRSPRKETCPDTWDLFGGHVEAGETFEQALARELLEELGVTPTRFETAASFSFEEGGEYRIYWVAGWSGDEPALRNEEHTALRWFTVAESRALQPLASELYRELFARSPVAR